MAGRIRLAKESNMRAASPTLFPYALSLAAALLARPGSAQTTVGVWTKAALLPVIQSEWDGAAIGDSLFCVGGEMKRTPATDANKASDELWIYDAKADKWTQGANMPGGRNHPAVCALDGKLYVFGGYDWSCCKNYPWPYGGTNAWQYDPKTKAWKTLANIPRRLGAGLAAPFEGKIYVMAGTDSGGYHSVAFAHVYDPATDTWKAVASMKNAREHTKGVVVDSLIYVIGGHTMLPGASSRINQAAVEAYSPKSDKWYDKGTMPTGGARGGIGLAYLGGKVYVFGGEGADFALFSRIDQFDPATGQWAKVNEFPDGGIHGHATVTYNGTAHLVAGNNPSGFNPKNYHYVFTPPGGGVSLVPLRNAQGLRLSNQGASWRLDGLAPGLHRLSIFDPTGHALLKTSFAGTGFDLSDASLAGGAHYLRIEGRDGAIVRLVPPAP
jgi:N-acetylneuraminic acid mutarotase